MSNNPFVTLAYNSLNKDIDKNFIEALQALMFFNEDGLSEKINEKFNYSFTTKVDDRVSSSSWFTDRIKNNTITFNGSNIHSLTDSDEYGYNSGYGYSSHTTALGQLLKQKLNKASYGSKAHFSKNKGDEYEIKEKINIGEFLIDKLAQNMRRIYSAKRKGGEIPKELGSSIEQLNLQQKNIYEALELVLPHINFDSSRRFFHSLFLGQARNCSNASAFFYLGLHEHLNKENEATHLNLLKNHFNLEDINSSIIKDLLNFKYPKEKSGFVDSFLSIMPDEFYKEISLYIAGNTFAHGNFMFDAFMYCAKNNVPLSDSDKLLFLGSILHSSSYINKLDISNAKPIAKIIKDYVNNLDLNDLCIKSIEPNKIHQNCVTNISLYLIDKITNHKLLTETILNDLKPNQESTILSKFDLTDQSLLLNTAKQLNHQNIRKIEVFQKFLSIAGNHMNNNTLSNILALDFKLIEIIKPIYMSRKLSKELKTEDDIEITANTTTKKYKI